MPQDSLDIVPSQKPHQPDSLSKSVSGTLTDQGGNDQPNYNGEAMLFVMAIFIAAFGSRWAVNRIRRNLRLRKAGLLYEDKHQQYDRLLSYYLPYYRGLQTPLRERFLLRTIQFMENKDFVYVDVAAEEQMPLLISAAAVQVTFGLEHYLLDYFRIIYVTQNAYQYGLYNVPFEGHVDSDGIYLSWSNFSKAFADYEDGSNVGLHEMAHALTYVNFIEREGRDNEFYHRFKAFSLVGRPVFEKISQDKDAPGFLGSYAGTNYSEFWAVCVEHFFEQPVLFRHQLPELYEAMTTLLNQDPLRPDLLLNPI